MHYYFCIGISPVADLPLIDCRSVEKILIIFWLSDKRIIGCCVTSPLTCLPQHIFPQYDFRI